MLVAKRDPFELGAHDCPVPQAGAAPTGSRFTRTLNVLQLLGALSAVPVGIGSAYSMYQANFSAEATCKSLRVNIVRMLDKNVDAGTRHMLVKRDVETFENTCGTVDPDATQAFKALLTANRPATPAVTATARRAEPRPAIATKQPAAITTAPAAETEPVKRDAASDAAWLAAVRSALVNHERGPARTASAAPVAPPSPAVPSRMLGELRTSTALPLAPLAAPALPPATAVAIAPAPQVDPDHPVPPAEIPAAAPQDAARAHSRFGELVAQIPFVGKTLADRVSR